MAGLMRSRRPRVVVATHIPTNSGLVQPVAEIGTYCREFEIVYIVDACQSVGQYPIDVQELGCDFLSATCRKFLRGPRATGFLYVSDRMLEQGYEPLFIDMYGARWSAPDAYTPLATAKRFEDWEFPYAAVIGAAVATRYCLSVGIDRIGERAPMLGARLRDGLEEIPGVRTLDWGEQRCAIVTFAIEGWESGAFKAATQERGINSALSFRDFAQYDFGDKDVDWCLRLSPHYYNTEDEVARAIEIVAELAGERPS
jgi:selenocysteine lyase/cysteine desulfurase